MSAIVRRRHLTAAVLSPAKRATFLRPLAERGPVSLAARRTGSGGNAVHLRHEAYPRRRQPPADVPAAHAAAGGFWPALIGGPNKPNNF